MCEQKCSSLSHFRQHFLNKHSRSVITNLNCFVCKIFFFNEKARDVHGQRVHCRACINRCMKDKSLMIPFEDHEKLCINMAVKEKQKIIFPGPPPWMITAKEVTAMANKSKVQIRYVIPMKQPTTLSSCKLCHNKLGVQRPPLKG